MRRARWGTIGRAAAVVAAIAGLLPISLAFLVAATPSAQFAQSGVGLPDPPTVDNLVELFSDPRTMLGPIVTTLAASILVAAVQTASSILAAYSFARLRFPGRRLLLGVTVVGYLVPPVVTLLPVYVMVATAGLAGSFLSLVLPVALASPFAVLLLFQWFARLPEDLFVAARIDGAGHLATIRHVVLPLSWPVIMAATVAASISTWNSYLWPRLVAGVDLPQVQVAIASLRTQHDNNWTLVLAGTALCLIPPLIATAIVAPRLVAGTETRTETS